MASSWTYERFKRRAETVVFLTTVLCILALARACSLSSFSARLTSAALSSEAKVVDAKGGKPEASDKVCEIADAPVLNLRCGIILVSPNEEV